MMTTLLPMGKCNDDGFEMEDEAVLKFKK